MGVCVRGVMDAIVYTFRVFSIAQIIPECNKVFVEFSDFLKFVQIQAVLYFVRRNGLVISVLKH